MSERNSRGYKQHSHKKFSLYEERRRNAYRFGMGTYIFGIVFIGLITLMAINELV